MSLLALLNQTASISSQSGYGADGRPAHSEGIATKCRFEPEVKRVMLPNGNVLTIDGTVIFAPDTTVSTEDKITLSGHDYKVVETFDVPGGNGKTHHKEVRVVKWQHS